MHIGLSPSKLPMSSGLNRPRECRLYLGGSYLGHPSTYVIKCHRFKLLSVLMSILSCVMDGSVPAMCWSRIPWLETRCIISVLGYGFQSIAFLLRCNVLWSSPLGTIRDHDAILCNNPALRMIMPNCFASLPFMKTGVRQPCRLKVT